MSRAWEDYAGPLCDCPGETYAWEPADRYDGYEPGDGEPDTDLDAAWDDLSPAERHAASLRGLRSTA